MAAKDIATTVRGAPASGEDRAGALGNLRGRPCRLRARLDGAEPHPPDDVAAGVDDAPVDGELARAGGVVRVDARFRGDVRAVPVGGDDEVHRGEGEAGRQLFVEDLATMNFV